MTMVITLQDDADSGYHTASSTLQSRGRHVARRPPGEWTLTREDLRCNIECFNNNNHGLIMSLVSRINISPPYNLPNVPDFIIHKSKKKLHKNM